MTKQKHIDELNKCIFMHPIRIRWETCARNCFLLSLLYASMQSLLRASVIKCMPTPGIELGPTGWQVRTFPRSHNDIHRKKHELQLYIIQTDLLHPIKKKFIASTNKENFPFVIKTYGRKSCYNFQGIRKKILPKTYGARVKMKIKVKIQRIPEMPCANAGDRNRTYRVTVQDGPTTPQRHICKKAQIKTIYNTNRF